MWSCWQRSSLSIFFVYLTWKVGSCDGVSLTSCHLYSPILLEMCNSLLSFSFEKIPLFMIHTVTHCHSRSRGHLSRCRLGRGVFLLNCLHPYCLFETLNRQPSYHPHLTWQITSCLCHSDISLLLSLAVTFTVINILTRIHSYTKEMFACG